jgi:hypothetical protein
MRSSWVVWIPTKVPIFSIWWVYEVELGGVDTHLNVGFLDLVGI